MVVRAPTRGHVGSFGNAHVLHYLRQDLRFEPVEDGFCRAVRQQHTNTLFKILISCCIGWLLQKSQVGSVLFVDQLLEQLKHVELEYLSLLMRAVHCILGGSNECSGNNYIFGTRERCSSLGFLKRGRSSGAISSRESCRIKWNIGGVHGLWAVGGSVDRRCQTDLICFDIIWSDIKLGVIWPQIKSYQILSCVWPVRYHRREVQKLIIQPSLMSILKVWEVSRRLSIWCHLIQPVQWRCSKSGQSLAMKTSRAVPSASHHFHNQHFQSATNCFFAFVQNYSSRPCLKKWIIVISARYCEVSWTPSKLYSAVGLYIFFPTFLNGYLWAKSWFCCWAPGFTELATHFSGFTTTPQHFTRPTANLLKVVHGCGAFSKLATSCLFKLSFCWQVCSLNALASGPS